MIMMGSLNTRTYRTLYQQSLPLFESFTLSQSNQFPILRYMKSLKHLRCTYGVKTTQLVHYTRYITSLETLDLHDNQLRAIGMKELAPCLRDLTQLRTLNVSANRLQKESQWLIPVLQHSFLTYRISMSVVMTWAKRGWKNLHPVFCLYPDSRP